MELPQDLAGGEPQLYLNHPPWTQPIGGEFMGLKVNNSLTGPEGRASEIKELVDFVPAHGRKVRWYTCGPTVYDSCHMGHARAYLTFDILRRILEDYFGYEVLYHVNITDIDDKIILRARRNKLLSDYAALRAKETGAGLATTVSDIQTAIDAKEKKLQGKLDAFTATVQSDSKAAKEQETKRAETALKLSNTSLVKTKVDAILRVNELGYTAGVAELGAQIEADLGISGATSMSTNELLQRIRMVLSGDVVTSDLRKAATDLQEIVSAVAIIEQESVVAALISTAKDELGEKLDDAMGSTITDHSIFNAHARKFEREFLEDMATLGIRDPDCLTRVSEYVPKIIAFVQRIVDKGLAYDSNGSVYLSIEAFKKAGHSYRKLKPGKETTAEDMAESEGDLASDSSEKRHPNDFALWKASKPGEPKWDSPWGAGRPGWHIECSAIASDIVGPYMDIHAGGIDLKFPHHDNELAQSEAYCGHHQWVSYFLHAGHLHIKGLKMGKSLKNFVTIRQALAEQTLPDGSTSQTTARQLRLMFLLQAWDRPMDYSDQEVDNAKSKERRFRSFFGNVKAYLRQDWLRDSIGWTEVDRLLHEKLSNVQTKVHEALCTNFNTKDALNELDSLVVEINRAFDTAKPAHLLIEKAAIYITKILRVFGVVEGTDLIGFPSAKSSGGDTESVIRPFVDTLLEFREKIRAASRAKAEPSEYLAACDILRDTALVDLGIRLEDGTDGKTGGWKMEDPVVLRRELAEKHARDAENKRKKLQRTIEGKERDLQKMQAAAMPPSEFFAEDKDKYSSFDETGFPTKLTNGEDLPKKTAKGLQKKFDTHVKAHQKLQNIAGGNIAQYLDNLVAEIELLKNKSP